MLKKIKPKHTPFIAAGLYLLLTLLIVWPFWGKGFVLTLDMVFTPQYDIDFEGLAAGYRMYNSLPLDLILSGLSKILGGSLVQKLILTLIFWASGFLMFKILPVKSFTGRFVAGVMYMFNPFVHQRLLAGHWNFLLAYAFTPLVIWGLYKLFTDKQFSTWKAAALWTMVIVFNVHHAFILAIVWVAMLVIRLFFSKNKRDLIWQQFTFVIWMVLFNAFWVLPFAFNQSHELLFYNLDHLTAFATRPDTNNGMLVNLLGMYGFWREYTDLELSKFILVKTWFFGVLIFVAMAWMGFLRLIKQKKKRWMALSILLVFSLSLLLSMGSSGELWFVNQWIFEYVPGFKGMREPQKFLALLPLVYAICIAFALEGSKRIKWKRVEWTHLVGFSLLAILIIYNAGLMHGGGLKTVQYPQNWYQLEAQLNKDEVILSLPFKQYSFSPIAQRDLLDPVPKFFAQQRVINSRNSEKIGLNLEKQAPLDESIEQIMADDQDQLPNLLTQLQVDYIILQKQGEFKDFDFLKQHPSVQLISQDSFSSIYSIQR